VVRTSSKLSASSGLKSAGAAADMTEVVLISFPGKSTIGNSIEPIVVESQVIVDRVYISWSGNKYSTVQGPGVRIFISPSAMLLVTSRRHFLILSSPHLGVGV
jgi:hypothetical protein